MNNQFSKENLEKLGIFELRNLAREIGVYSPTTYKKQELIDNVLLIASGKLEPHVAKTKQGRPPKSISGVNNLLDIFIPKNVDNTSEDSNSNYDFNIGNLANLTAMEGNSNLEYNAKDELNSGILEVYNGNYGFCLEKSYITDNKSENFFVSNTYISKYNLKSGDELTGYTKKVSDTKPMIMYKLESINGSPVKDFNVERKNFNESKAIHPNEIINRKPINKLNGKYLSEFIPVGKGQRILIVTPNNIDYSYLILAVLNTLKHKDDNFVKSCILIDERPEDITEYEDNLETSRVISTTFEDNPEQAIQKIKLEFERAKRNVEIGKDVVIILSNLNRLMDIYTKFNASKNDLSLEKTKDKSKLMVKRLLNNARNTQDMGTLSIISIIEDNADEEFISELKELCNMQLIVKREKYLKKNNIWFDILKSKTRKLELLLNKKDYNKIDEFMADVTEQNVKEKTEELEKLLLDDIK
jgi:transcription termination factor Rho